MPPPPPVVNLADGGDFFFSYQPSQMHLVRLARAEDVPQVGDSVPSTSLLLRRGKCSCDINAQTLRAICSTRGVVGNFLQPIAVECLSSNQQQHSNWPQAFAPEGVEESTGRVAQIFGADYCVEATVEMYKLKSAGKQKIHLPLGSRVVKQLVNMEYVQDCPVTKVIRARHCDTGHVAHRRCIKDL